MTNQIYGINYEWISSSGHCLIFSKDTAWLECDLSSMEKKMLLNYPISRLLPLQVNEIDMQISLHYKLGLKKSLRHILQHQAINEADGLRILYAIVSTIADSTSHLLSEERYLLHDEFIYIGSDYTDINLIYLPVLDLIKKPALQRELLNLSTKLFEKIKLTLTQKSKLIIQQFESSDFQLNTVKNMLIQAITEVASEPKTITELDQILPQTSSIQQSIHLQTDFQTSRQLEPWLPQSTKDRIQQWVHSHSHSHNPILVIVSGFSILIIWVFFILTRSVGTFNLSLGISLLIILLSIKLNRSIGKMETGDLSGLSPLGKPAPLQNSFVIAMDYYDHLADQTTLLAPSNVSSDVTVLLPRPIQAILELQYEEHTEKINISQNPFIIGRNTEDAQYAVNWVGLSRKHIEINRNGMEYEAKDLGSKNGSYLNEDQMVPFKAYVLNEGDCIKIVEKQFIYKKI